MQSKAATVAEYLASLPPDRREAIEAVRNVILKNLDADYAEGMSYGMIGYAVPHTVFPAGYHCDPKQPLPFAGLASQKQHMSVYLMGLYCGTGVDAGGRGTETAEARWFREAWTKAGKKLDMGKACIRFKKLDDVALDVLGEAIRRVPAKLYIERYVSLMDPRGKTESGSGAGKKPAAKPAKKAAKQPAKKPATKTNPVAKKSARKATKSAGTTARKKARKKTRA